MFLVMVGYASANINLWTEVSQSSPLLSRLGDSIELYCISLLCITLRHSGGRMRAPTHEKKTLRFCFQPKLVEKFIVRSGSPN